MTALAKLPLNFQPGEAWEYGPATDVLGRLVEVISGKPLDVFFRERIFKPLGMTDTFFYLPKDRLARQVTAYAPSERRAEGSRPAARRAGERKVVLRAQAGSRARRPTTCGCARCFSTAGRSAMCGC